MKTPGSQRAAAQLMAWAILTGVSWAALAAPDELLTSAPTPQGEVVPYVLNRQGATPDYVLILFAGGNGIINPRLEEGRLVYEKKNNFLLRARPHWVDGRFATVAVDASPDEGRMQVLLDDLHRRFPDARLYLVSTSRGSASALSLAPYLGQRIAGQVHTAAVAAIGQFDSRSLPNRHLIVHHRLDACPTTPYAGAELAHTRYGTDFIAMEGGTSSGKVCEAFAYHGFNGIEQETVATIKTWILQASPERR